MKKVVIFLFFCIGVCCTQKSIASESDKELLDRLFSLSLKSINSGSNVLDDEIMSFCRKAETRFRNNNDYQNLLRVQQVVVNSYCLKGDIGLAIAKAQQMYKDASAQGDPLCIAWAVQSIGVTYMYANQYSQAYNTFAEVENMMKDKDLENDIPKFCLILFQINVCMKLNKLDEMRHYLLEARRLLDHVDIPNKEDFAFYIQYYQTLYYISSNEAEQAWRCLEQLKQMRPNTGIFDRLYYDTFSLYCELTKHFKQALNYCDSALEVVKRRGNMDDYKNQMKRKAILLKKEGRKKEACLVFEEVSSLDDSLNISAYTRQIDSLRVVYWVDQMELKNNAAFNRMLAWILICGIAVLSGAFFLFRIARKKNKRLIASRKRLEEIKQETADSIYSKSLFLSNMSHEIRTPLNAIVGFTGLLTSEEIIEPEMRQQCSDLIKQNSDLLLNLMNDVADISALNSRRMKFSLIKSEIVALCGNVIETVERVKRTSAELRFVSQVESLLIITDPERLQQVLINLLINATKFTSEGTITLVLEVDQLKKEVIFSIEDTGCGIPLEKQPNIFKRFEKLHEGVQGAGLGLSICLLIIENLGGKIWIDSSYTKGARFMFTHPFDKERSEL